MAVHQGRIVEIGSVKASSSQEIEADGLALMPGIVDLHTHYDAQVTWDRTLSPSPSLGVTTAVMGNCGFGIAPCPEAQRETMLRNLSVVEGMDLGALLNGTRWDFESFGEYLDALERIRPYANVAVLAGHSCIRTAVMGEEASSREVPSDEQLRAMREHVRAAMDAGAIGFASSFSPNHSGWGGRPMPSTICRDEELKVLASVLHGRSGIFVTAAGSRATPEYLEEICAANGRPAFMVTVNTMYSRGNPGRAMDLFERAAAAQARGRQVWIQENCQPLSFDFTLREPYILFSHDAFAQVKAASPDRRKEIYAKQEFRNRLRENLKSPGSGVLFHGDWSQIEQDGVPVTELARRAGKDPLDYVFDLPLDQQLVGKLYQNDDAGVAPLLKHPAGVIALSDAGAHLIYFCDAGFGLHFLAHWVRETGTFTMEEAVRRLTSHPASLYGIPNRGRIAPGAWADLLLFDPARVGVSPLKRVNDMPAGGARMVREPVGVEGVWVNGTRIFADGSLLPLASGPGQVLRSFNA
ncbi:MAG TPA: amidohydrolase family protein [Burkholderiales bacterium]|nr:amidohydrolase family protein [Burkholderiales bacterium]